MELNAEEVLLPLFIKHTAMPAHIRSRPGPSFLLFENIIPSADSEGALQGALNILPVMIHLNARKWKSEVRLWTRAR